MVNLTWKWLELRSWFSSTKLSRMIWWVRHRTTHRFTSRKLKTLKPGYYDPDTLILHFSFEIFAEFMEFQLSDKAFVVWEYDESCFPEFMLEDDPEAVKKEIEERNATWTEMKALYNWWLEYKDRDDDFVSFEAEQEQREEERDALIRLAKIRDSLWD